MSEGEISLSSDAPNPAYPSVSPIEWEGVSSKNVFLEIIRFQSAKSVKLVAECHKRTP